MKFQNLYILIIVAGLFIASSGGRNDARAGAPGDNNDCSSCHGGAATNSGTIDFVGLPAEFEPGQTYDFQVVVNEPDADGVLDAAGFQLVATNGFNNLQRGSFTVVDAGTRINPINRLVHNTPKLFSGTEAVWDVQYTTPNDPTLFQDIIFYLAGNSVNLNGNTGGDVVYSNSALIVLPVEWTSFNVEPLERGNYITWETAMEVDNDYFEIQKSSDGKSFNTVAKINGVGFSSESTSYEFMDEEILSPIYYYRIMQVDFNGKEDFSEVVSVRNEINPIDVQVYPTTVQNDLTINSEIEINASIFNSTGQLVVKKNNVSIVDFTNHNNGVYFIQLFTSEGNYIETKKIIKI